MSEIEDRELRREVFGEVADVYEAARTDYPPPLVDAVLDFARPAGGPALEVGAGTGKATMSFAERGVAITCLEPDARMAAVLARKVAGHPLVSVAISTLEQWDGLDGRFGLLFAAQSWHWVDPERSWDLAARALRPGGALALFWNNPEVPHGDLHAALTAVHQKHGQLKVAGNTLKPAERVDSDPAELPAAQQLLADERFTDVTFPEFDVAHEFTTRRYVDYLDSLSAYRVLPAEVRTALLADVAEAVDDHGGTFTMAGATTAIFARKRA